MLKYTDVRFNSNHFDKNLNLHKHSQSDDDRKISKKLRNEKEKKERKNISSLLFGRKGGMKEWWFENHCLLTFLWNWRGPLWRVDEFLYLVVLSKLLLPSRATVVRTESTFLHRIWYNSDNLSPKCACALLIETVQVLSVYLPLA